MLEKGSAVSHVGGVGSCENLSQYRYSRSLVVWVELLVLESAGLYGAGIEAAFLFKKALVAAVSKPFTGVCGSEMVGVEDC